MWISFPNETLTDPWPGEDLLVLLAILEILEEVNHRLYVIARILNNSCV